MDLGDVSEILPLGLLAGGHVTPIDHLYFAPASWGSPRDAYPVYAMADGAIVEISRRTVQVESGKPRAEEYRMVFQHTCSFYTYFDLVTSLDPAILAGAPQLGTQNYSGPVHIPVRAGQTIGRIGGQTLDTAVYNFAKTLKGFVTPSAYDAEFWKIHTDEFFPYFDEPLRSELLAKNPRTAEPRSGKIDYDVDGRLVGNWFQEGTNFYAGVTGMQPGVDGRGYWSGHLAFVYDAVHPQRLRISVGDVGGRAVQYAVRGNAPDPASVDASSGIVRYELLQAPGRGTTPQAEEQGAPQGVALVELLERRRIRFEVFPGATPAQAQAFTSAARIYVR